jgi:hypothetical protein
MICEHCKAEHEHCDPCSSAERRVLDLVRRLREVADIMEKLNRPPDEADIRVIRATLWEIYK